MPRICSLCRQSAEASTKDQKFSACRKCVREKLLPLCLDSLGKADLSSAVAALSAEPTAAEKKLAKLTAGQAGQTGQRKPLEFSRGTGRPATPTTPARRKMTPAEQRLALARAEARSAGQVHPGDVEAMVAKAGLKTTNGTAAELSKTAAVATATGKPAGTATGTRTGTPIRKLPATRQPTKAEIMAKVKKAGFDA
jgi:hypothetical protein